MAVSLTKKKPLPKAPTGYAPGGISYAKPAIVKPKLPAGMAPINAGMSDAAREAQLTGGGAWGTYSTPTVPYQQPTVKPAVTAPARPTFKGYVAEGIPGDWEVQDAETAFATRMAQLRSAFQGDIRDALVNLGLPGSPEVGKEFGSYIDADTIAKAAQNKYSTAAQIAAQEQKQRKMQTAALAARGMLRSGQTTNQLAGIAAEGERGRFQAVQDFLTGARGGLKQLGETEAGLQGNVATARANAAARLAQQYGWDFPDQGEEPAPAAAGGTTTVTKPVVKPKETAAQRALRLRSEALNRRYRL